MMSKLLLSKLQEADQEFKRAVAQQRAESTSRTGGKKRRKAKVRRVMSKRELSRILEDGAANLTMKLPPSFVTRNPDGSSTIYTA